MTKFTINISPELGEEDKLIRYFSFNKFLSLFENKELYLAKSDSFDDIFEGEYISQAYEYCRYLFPPMDGKSQNPSKKLRENVKRCKGNSFISCWNLDEFENDAFWKLYGTIAIKTTVKKLKTVTLSSNNDFLGLAKGNISKVEYIDHQKSNNDLTKELLGSELEPLTKKNIGFAFEKEVRLIVNFFEHTGKDLLYKIGKSLRLKIQLESLIDEIIISPYESEEFYNLIKKFVEPHGLAEKVKWSMMKIPPYEMLKTNHFE